jgi:two-component system nitrate/nitrite response regulator NarL
MGTVPPAIRIFVVSNVRLHREGLAQTLQGYAQIEVVGTGPAGIELLGRVRECRPDAVLLDSSVPGGLTLVRSITEVIPGTRVVAFAVAESDAQIIACAESGAAAFAAAEASVSELVEVVEHAVRGELRCSPRVAATLFTRLAKLAAGQDRPYEGLHLTGREREIIALLDQGLSNKEIARHLRIETATVKNHVHNILEKLHLQRRGEAAAYARRLAPTFRARDVVSEIRSRSEDS